MLAIAESLLETGLGGVEFWGGLQGRESRYFEFATAAQLSLFLTSSCPAHQGGQTSHPLFLSLPNPVGFFWVAVLTWPAPLELQIVLSWPAATPWPWVEQKPPTDQLFLAVALSVMIQCSSLRFSALARG